MAETTCSIDGCSAPKAHRAMDIERDLCSAHYKRWRRKGALGGAIQRKAARGEAQAWLDEHLSRESYPDECTEWPFGTMGAGYGMIWDSDISQNVYVTHLVLEADGRPREGDDVARHACHNPPCVNPNHLSWGSHEDNMADMGMAGRAYRPKLGEDDVRAIRRRREEGATYDVIGREFGISHVTVGNIVRRKTWAHVE